MSSLSIHKTVASTKKSRLDGSVFFSFETLSEIESTLEEIFSPSAASVILYTATIKSGSNSCRKIMKNAGTKKKALDHLSILKADQNWGKLSFQDVDFVKGSGKLAVIDSFETIARRTTQPCCHLFRGFLQGFLSELFGKTIKISEQKCAGKGDEYCEFIFG